MNATKTERETETVANEYVLCTICGGYSAVVGAWRTNTCSQDCARIAAIVEAINGWTRRDWSSRCRALARNKST